MTYSPSHDVVGLVVYQKAGEQQITMDLVRSVLAELKDHPAGCTCGSCLWVEAADPVKVYLATVRWEHTAARSARLGQPLERHCGPQRAYRGAQGSPR